MGVAERKRKMSQWVVVWMVFGSVVLAQMPLIVETDFGSFPDDTWALGLLLASPEVDIKLIVTSTLNTTQRAQVLGEFLTSIGRDDIPIGLGIDYGGSIGALYEYGQDFDLTRYRGPLFTDGIQAMKDLISEYPAMGFVQLSPPLCLAQTIVDLPEQVGMKVHLVAMSGSLNSTKVEYNVAFNISASQIMYEEKYRRLPMTIATTDTSGMISLCGPNLDRLLNAEPSNALVHNILDQVRLYQGVSLLQNATVMFDAQAAFMAFSVQFITVQLLDLVVTDSGFTIISSQGRPVLTSTSWVGLDAFQTLLTDRLLAW